MTDVSQIRKQNQDSIRQLQQDKAEKRKELIDQAQKDMKELKAHYKNENQKLEKNTTAAITHIQKENADLTEVERQEKISAREANAATYSRTAAQARQQQAKSESRSMSATTASVEPTDKENDSFYKVIDRGSEIDEQSDGYVIKAYVPQSEKDDLRLTIQNNKAILSGKRKFQNSVENENKKISTNNFQTFHEEFKFDRPIATTGMTRERDGDYLNFFIPKLESLKFDEES